MAKWNKNDSPEIPDREETSDIPDLPSGGGGGGRREREREKEREREREREREQRNNDRYRSKHAFIITHIHRDE